MPNVTENYGLKKPLPEEFYDVNVQNENMDKIDAELKKKYDPDNKPTPADIGSYTKDETNTLLQNKLGGIESTDYPGCYYRTVDGAVEWFNPPMQLGGKDADGNPINEYRTTERYLGKPVYAKLIHAGSVPVGGAVVYIDGEDDPHDIGIIVMADTYSRTTGQYNNRNIVYIEGGRALGGSGLQSFITLGNNHSIELKGYDILVKYTKITD